MSRAAEIAEKLTKAQRAIMLRAEQDGHLGKLFIRWWHGNSTTLKAIRRHGLGFTVWSGLCLTPLGLEVRAILKEQADAQP